MASFGLKGEVSRFCRDDFDRFANSLSPILHCLNHSLLIRHKVPLGGGYIGMPQGQLNQVKSGNGILKVIRF
jgi:hypothetical protein